MPIESLAEFGQAHARVIAELHRRAEVARWNVDEPDWAAILYRSAVGRFGGGPRPSPAEIERYLTSLSVEDLALACACIRGDARGWEHLVTTYRPILYAAARTLARDESRAREMTDSLWAELYGVGAQARRPLLEYFHGRSRLSTWLRAVLAQRHVDAYRAAARQRARAEAEARESVPDQARACEPPDPDRPRYLDCLRRALQTVLAVLEPRDRLRLSYYYFQGLTLAEVGRLLGEHESTVSRRLDRARRNVRKQVERRLRVHEHLSDEQIRLCYDYALEEWPFDLGPGDAPLTQDRAGGGKQEDAGRRVPSEGEDA